MTRKILFLLTNHFTSDTRVLHEARSLVHGGYDVTIRCLHDKDLPEREVIDGINVERVVPSARNHARRFISKVGLLGLFSVKTLKGVKHFDYLHCHDLATLPVGVLGKALGKRGVKLVYDTHEYAVEQNHQQKRLKPLLKIMERACIRFADAVITVSDSIAREYQRLYGISKPYVVLNTPPFQDPKPHNKFRQAFGISDETIVFLYQGGLRKNRGIEMTLEAFYDLPTDDKVIVFMGYGPLQNMVIEAAKQHKTIFYHEAVHPDVLLDYTSSADIGILYYENNCLNHYYCSPNKFFEYTMAGIPVIVSNLYELGRLVNTHQNGVIVIEDTANALRDVVKATTRHDIERMKANTTPMRAIYNWEAQEDVLLKLYASL